MVAWLVAQLVKVFSVLIKERRLKLHLLVASGGMPSSHSATVSALATAVGLLNGLNSVIFGIAAILAIVVMYDAAGIRQAVSRQSIVLDRIVNELKVGRPRGEVERDLKELVGHTPYQVFVGAFIGILVAWLWLVVV
ncbi:MAG: divergent PAP2 family protein [Dehalococcoidia bacterium]|nr:MAG: divergent PAP2 family protein [Dehalococcoidia bacterium]